MAAHCCGQHGVRAAALSQAEPGWPRGMRIFRFRSTYPRYSPGKPSVCQASCHAPHTLRAKACGRPVCAHRCRGLWSKAVRRECSERARPSGYSVYSISHTTTCICYNVPLTSLGPIACSAIRLGAAVNTADRTASIWRKHVFRFAFLACAAASLHLGPLSTTAHGLTLLDSLAETQALE